MSAPIALFVYNRLDHTQQTVAALQKNQEAATSDLYVFSDGPKKPEHAHAVNEIRKYVHGIQGFNSVHIVEREINLGLSNSIIRGVGEVVEKYGRIIVLEDDLIVGTYFLDYMNRALDHYEKDDRVASIHGYVYPLESEVPEMFFLRGADCWGWATWKRGWDLFEENGVKLKKELTAKQLVHEFDYDDSYPFFNMLLNQIKGLNQSWAIRWHAACFLKDKLTLYPGKSLVFNIGLDNSGTHCSDTDSYDTEINMEKTGSFPAKVQADNRAREAFKYFFKKMLARPNDISLISRVINKVKRMYKR